MKYCKRCILPDTRPGLIIDSKGICSACKADDYKKTINWSKRKKQLDSIMSNVKKNRTSGYDCVIPVSGGKDSTWQVAKCLECGLHILAVTWKTPARTELGQKNLDNLVRLGVDHIDYSINLNVEKRFMYKALLKTGSTALPMHMALYTIPLKIAVVLDIPLIIWGARDWCYASNVIQSPFKFIRPDGSLDVIALDRQVRCSGQRHTLRIRMPYRFRINEEGGGDKRHL